VPSKNRCPGCIPDSGGPMSTPTSSSRVNGGAISAPSACSTICTVRSSSATSVVVCAVSSLSALDPQAVATKRPATATAPPNRVRHIIKTHSLHHQDTQNYPVHVSGIGAVRHGCGRRPPLKGGGASRALLHPGCQRSAQGGLTREEPGWCPRPRWTIPRLRCCLHLAPGRPARHARG